MKLNLHFKAEPLAVGEFQEITMLSSKIYLEDALGYLMGSSTLHEPQFLPLALFPKYAPYATQLKQWGAAFDLFFAYLKTSNHKDLVWCDLMRGDIFCQLILYTKALVMLSLASFSSDSGPDRVHLREDRPWKSGGVLCIILTLEL
jgi:hypothetical protein